jgi:hypothetical protein
MGASSRKLAAALAQRLNDIVPAPFRLSAEDGEVHIYIADELDSWLLTAPVVEDESRDLAERLETAAESVLSALQDSVSEHTRSPWPSTDGRTMALPGVRWDGKSIHLWFGRDEAAAVVRMPPISITEISVAGGPSSPRTGT